MISPSAKATQALESPKHVDQTSRLFSLIPTLLFEDSISSEELQEMSEEDSMEEVKHLLHVLCKHFGHLKTKLTLAFTEAETGYNLVIKDLATLQSNAQLAQGAVGSPIPVNGKVVQSVWGE